MAQVKSIDNFYGGATSAFEIAHERTRTAARSRGLRAAMTKCMAALTMAGLVSATLINYAGILEEQVRITSTESRIIELSRSNEIMQVEILKSKNYGEVKKKVLSSEFLERSMSQGVSIDLSKDNFPE